MQREALVQSTWITFKAAELHLIRGLSQKAIAEQLSISPSTVSRLLRKAAEENMISVHLNHPYSACIEMSDKLQHLYGLREAVVIPNPHHANGSYLDPNAIRMNVALEGARFLQRVMKPKDILGIGWGRTIYHLIYRLNPCQKSDNSFVTLHGGLSQIGDMMDLRQMVSRMAMSLGGSQHILELDGLYPRGEQIPDIHADPRYRPLIDLQHRITIAVTGVGCLYPELTSPLLSHPYLTETDIYELQDNRVCADFNLHFIDLDGNECNSSLKNRIISIDLECFRRIPCKIIVASGEEKALALRAVMSGRFADIIIIDEFLARSILELN